MAYLTVRLFGPVSVSVDVGGDARAVPLGRSAQTLLCWLALHAPAPVPRDVIAAGLWPDADPDRARSRLSTALWRLKAQLGAAGCAAGLETGADAAIGLCPDVVADIDTRRFEAVAGAYLSDPTEARWADLVALRAPGALMAGWYAVWALSARVRLDDLWERCLATRLGRAEAAGDGAALQDAAAALLEIDPLAEDVHRALIRLYLADGRRGQALKQYNRCRDALVRDLGVPPAAETEALMAEIGAVGPPGACADGTDVAVPRAADLDELRRILIRTQATLARLTTRLDGFLSR